MCIRRHLVPIEQPTQSSTVAGATGRWPRATEPNRLLYRPTSPVGASATMLAHFRLIYDLGPNYDMADVSRVDASKTIA